MDLSAYPIIDQHAHNVLRPEEAAALPFAAAFTEAGDPELIREHARQTLCYRRSLRDLAGLLECAPDEQAVLARRAELGLEALSARCFEAAGLDALLLDDGFLPERTQPIGWHSRFVASYRILRLETLAEQAIMGTSTFAEFVEHFRAQLDPPPAEVVAVKSIAAYRCGLAVEPTTPEQARTRYEALKSAGFEPPRLTDKVLIDYLLGQALELAARHELPIQFHTGFGDPDLDLRLANPLHLRPLLEEPRYRRVPFVLLHLYPFVREGGYLASVYPQVHVDFGLAVPLLSVAGMRDTVRMLLELAPTSKVLYSSDAHLVPDLFYLGAIWGRTVLGAELDEALRAGDLNSSEAEAVARGMLRDNAWKLYRLDRFA
jgi:predicted TIM-barrel fold metal-dependent hydrolase